MASIYRTSKPVAYPQPGAWQRRSVSTRRKQKASLKPVLIAGAAVVVVLILLFLIAASLIALKGLNLLAPGTRSGGVNIGWMTPDQATRAVDRAWNYDRKLLVTDGSRAWPAAPLDFGLWVNPSQTVENALDVKQAADVPPVVEFRPQMAKAQLARWAPLVERAPKDATISYTGGRWTAAPGEAGARLDVDATLAQVQADPRVVLSSGILQLVVRPVQPRVSDLSQELGRVQALLSEPLSIAAYDPIDDETVRWDTTPEDMAGWMRIGERNGAPALEVDSQKFNAYLASQQGRLGEGREFEPLQSNADLEGALANGRRLDLDIRRLPTEYVVQAGDTLVSIGFDLGIPYWRIQEANPGLSAGSLSVGDTITIPSQNVMLPLPVVRSKRVVISISQQRLWEYENGSLRREETISTGIDRSPTYAGVFQVQSHELEAYASVWDLYMPHFLGIYEAVPGFMNGLHGLPTLSSGVRLWASVLGSKASYGCIILTLDAAEDLYNWAEDGVVVEIQK